LFQGLSSNLFADPVFDTLVFFLGDLLSNLSIGWVLTENESVKEGDTGHNTCHDEPKESSERPTHRTQNHIEKESIQRVEQKAKVHGDQNTEEFELGLEAADQ